MIFLNLLLASNIVTTTPSLPVRQKLEARVATTAARLTKLSGTISSVSSTNLVVNGSSFNITTNTILLRRFGAKTTISEFSVGDEVQIVAKGSDAKLIRNLSIQKRRGTFMGTVSNTSATGLTLTTLNRGPQVITFSSTTRFVDRKEKPTTLTAVLDGHKVRVKGLWDSKLNTITEVVQVKDFSIPETP